MQSSAAQSNRLGSRSQDVFDAHGRLWWVAWLLPRRAAKRGNGVHAVISTPWR